MPPFPPLPPTEPELSLALRNAASTPLEFVTLSNPNQIKSRETQRVIRRQAGRSGAQKSQKHRRPLVQVLEVRFTSRNSHHQTQTYTDGPVSSPDTPNPAQVITTSELLGALRPLGAGWGLNPYQNLPIKPDSGDSRLIELVIHHVAPKSHAMFQVWVSIALEDQSAFHVLLSIAATDFGARCSIEASEATKHYAISLNSVTSRMNDPNYRMSEGFVGAVLALACQGVRQLKFDRWSIHMQGLKKIIESRGGMHTLKNSYALRLSIFWVDTIGALALDHIPLFPSPEDLVDRRDIAGKYQHLQASLSYLKSQYDGMSGICEAFEAIADMAEFMNSNGTTQDFWQDDIPFSRNFLPVAHKILSLERRVASKETPFPPSNCIHEIIRLTCLLFLASVKRRFRVQPYDVPYYGERVLKLLTQSLLDWTPFADLYLWTLVVSATAAFTEDREWIVSEISRYSSGMSWHDVTVMVRSIAWVEEAAAYELEILGKEVQNQKV